MLGALNPRFLEGELCVPPAAKIVEDQRDRRKKAKLRALFVQGCRPGADKIIRCSPELMRGRTEERLRALGLYRPTDRLTLEAYAMARNIASEAGQGSGAEKLAIGEVLLNRARRGKGVTSLTLKDGSFFARQRGSNPPVSSVRDPNWEDIVAAELVLTGRSGNISRGATHYFSPRAMDFLFRREQVRRDRFGLYDSWSRSLVWVGYVPGVDLERQFFMREGSPGEIAEKRPIGLSALKEPTPASVLSPPECSFLFGGVTRLLFAAGGLAAFAGAAYWIASRLASGPASLPWRIGR